MKTTFKLSQPQRLASLIIDLAIIALGCYFMFDTIYPPIAENKGFWGYSAILSVLVGSKLITPFYVKPADAISYSVPAFISLMLINDWTSWSSNQKWVFSLAAIFSAFIFSLGILNIISNAINSEWAKKISNSLRVILSYIGQPEFVYTPLILFAIFSYHMDSSKEVLIIASILGMTVWWSLGSFLTGFYYKLKSSLSSKSIKDVAGYIVAFQEPKIVLLRQKNKNSINKHDLLLINDMHGPAKLAVSLNYVGRSEGILVRAVDIQSLSSKSTELIGNLPYDNSAIKLNEELLKDICKNEGIEIEQQTNIVGLVAQDTSIERLYFEVVDNTELEEGRLISVQVGSHRVLYQIVGGVTKEEIVQQKNTFGFIRGQAQQIGIWDENNERFKQSNWLPEINTPVYLIGEEDTEFSENAIGHFPKTNYQVNIKDINELVTHNTAILGILGIGKSMLSIEITERLLANKIKVLCVDLTDEYKQLLPEYYVDWYHKDIAKNIEAIAVKSKTNVQKSVEEGGGVKELKNFMTESIRDFVNNDEINFLVLNPSDFEVWRQDSKPFQNEASMASLTPTEITNIISDASLDIMREKGKTKEGKARLCLIYEEAHSLVPEFNSVVAPGDKSATNGTARAILQGRKYGMGCILITQRTANVTKTILNQCNTVFAMRTFDDTGKEFLSNYLGRSYAESLHNLQPQQAVLFGKASSCENPVLISLNDRQIFTTEFRKTNEPPKLPEKIKSEALSTTSTSRPSSIGTDDDIPF